MNKHHSDRARLQHIRDAIGQIFLYLEEDQARGNRTRDAVILQLQIIGEACNHVSDTLRQQHPHIPWHAIVAMRNHLTHGYFSVDVKDVWDTVDNDLTALLDQILSLLEDKNIT